MALFEQFPYTNFHELNLDWALQVAESAKEHLDGYDEDMATIAQNVLDTESWKNAAAGSASAAAGSAASAAGEVLEAEAWAKGTKNGAAVPSSAPQYQNNAKYWAEDKTNVYEAEAWAIGTKNGTPVTSDAEQYENNSKYYAEASKDAADNAIEGFSHYSNGTCFYLEISNITVKSVRNATSPNGTVSTLNIPGLVVFASHIPDPEDIDDSYRSDLNMSAYWGYYEPVIGHSMVDNSRYILFPLTGTGLYAQGPHTGEYMKLIAMRAWDTTTNDWAADNTSIGPVTVIVTNTRFTTLVSGVNDTDIGVQIT